MDITVATPSLTATWRDGELDVSPDAERERVDTLLAAPIAVLRAEAGDDGSIVEAFDMLQPGSAEHFVAAMKTLPGASVFGGPDEPIDESV